MNKGFMNLHRQLLDWEWFDNSQMVHLWIYLLLKANYQDDCWHGITIPRGSLVTSLESISKATKLSIRQIRTCITHLKSTGEITIKTTNRFSIITICKYDAYNFGKAVSDIQNDKQTDTQSDKQVDKQTTTDNKDNKEINNFREDKSSADSGETALKKKRKKPVYNALGGKCREVFEEFYKGKVGEDYQYSAADGSNMKYLLNKIKSARESRNMPIDDENMISAFRAFLGSINDEWVLRNLSVKVINSKYNEIVSSAKAGKKFDIFDINHSYDGYDPHRYDNSMELWNKTK